MMTNRSNRSAALPAVAGEGAVKALLHTLRVVLIGPATAYHPERHYMRGPGPKWREKRGLVLMLNNDEIRG
jgi:hypothetical protein